MRLHAIRQRVTRPVVRCSAAGFLAVLLASCAPGDDGADMDVPAGQAGINAVVDSMRAAEAPRLESAGAHARRESSLLIVPTAAGPAVFEDDRTDSDMMALYSYQGRLQNGFGVIEVLFYEGATFILVDERTGGITEIDSVPVVSPDGTRFVTTSMDLEAGYRPNRIAIYRFEGDAVIEEWEAEPMEWGPSDARWLGPDLVAFTHNRLDGSAPSGYVPSPAMVVRGAAGWQLQAGRTPR
jgi:hypothetical protein